MTLSYERVDPPGHDCADCQSGVARPFDPADDDMLRALLHGHVEDSTGKSKDDVPDWINHLGQVAFGDLLVEEWVAGRLMSHPSAGVVRAWQSKQGSYVLDERIDGRFYPTGVSDPEMGTSRTVVEDMFGPITEVTE